MTDTVDIKTQVEQSKTRKGQKVITGFDSALLDLGIAIREKKVK